MTHSELTAMAKAQGLLAGGAVCYACSDGNLFVAANKHFAESHARTYKLDLYELRDEEKDIPEEAIEDTAATEDPTTEGKAKKSKTHA